jgi:DNA processing protein
VDVAYPAAHAALFERIAECGTLISESPPGVHPTRPAFLIRNRLIAALAYGTVVVEARHRSGALSTSRHAAELNRIVMGIPGPITSPESSGVHALIKAGAELVTSADDVLSLIAPLGSTSGEVITDTEREWDALSPAEQVVYEALPRRQAVGVDSIFTSLTTDLSLPAILGALVGLAQRGLVAEGLDGSWKRTRTLRGAGA